MRALQMPESPRNTGLQYRRSRASTPAASNSASNLLTPRQPRTGFHTPRHILPRRRRARFPDANPSWSSDPWRCAMDATSDSSVVLLPVHHLHEALGIARRVSGLAWVVVTPLMLVGTAVLVWVDVVIFRALGANGRVLSFVTRIAEIGRHCRGRRSGYRAWSRPCRRTPVGHRRFVCSRRASDRGRGIRKRHPAGGRRLRDRYPGCRRPRRRGAGCRARERRAGRRRRGLSP